MSLWKGVANALLFTVLIASLAVSAVGFLKASGRPVLDLLIELAPYETAAMVALLALIAIWKRSDDEGGLP